MNELIKKFNDLSAEVNENAEKFYAEKPNKSAGTRLRQNLMELTKLSKEIRKDVQDKKNQL